MYEDVLLASLLSVLWHAAAAAVDPDPFPRAFVFNLGVCTLLLFAAAAVAAAAASLVHLITAGCCCRCKGTRPLFLSTQHATLYIRPKTHTHIDTYT